MSIMERRKIFYGWYVVAAGCVASAMTTGVISNCFSLFVKPVCADMGISRQAMSMTQTIYFLVMMGFAMVWGWLSSRINLHRWMCISAAVSSILFGCFGLMQDIRVGYAIMLVLTPFVYIVSMNIFNYIIGNWFVKKRGLAVGLNSMGSGIGPMLLSPFISEVIVQYGWRVAYFILAVIMLICMLPAMVFVVRIRPEDKGLEPYGLDEIDDAGSGANAAVIMDEGYTYQEAVRMPAFWAILFCSISLALTSMAFYPTLTPHLSDCGYTVQFAALMSSIVMGALAVGKVALGWMFDKFGNWKTVMIANTCTLAGVIAMMFCEHMIALVVIVIGVGLGCCFGPICVPILMQNLFGMKEYNAIYSKVVAAMGLGGAIAPTITGWTYDTYGTYMPAYVGTAILTVISIVVLARTLPRES